MRTGQGRLTQIFLGPDAAGQIACPAALVPAPGQYLLAASTPDPGATSTALSVRAGSAGTPMRHGGASPLPVPLFMAGPATGGFLAAPPLPETWLPGAPLSLRGPLGKGFNLPRTARRVALVALGTSAARLLPLARLALGQDASVLLVCDYSLESLPTEVEVLPTSARTEAAEWADYLAADSEPGGLGDLRVLHGEALMQTPLPCGGLADCGACAVHLKRGYLLACKDGPVVDLKRLTG